MYGRLLKGSSHVTTVASNPWFLNDFLLLFYFKIRVLWVCVWAYKCECVNTVAHRSQRHQVPWNWNYRIVKWTMGMLGPGLWSSAKAACTISSWTISLSLNPQFWVKDNKTISFSKNSHMVFVFSPKICSLPHAADRWSLLAVSKLLYTVK